MWTVSPQGWSPQENRQWRYIHSTHIHAPVVGFSCIHVVYGVHVTGKFKRHEHTERVILGICCTLLPSTTHASLCFMTVCMFMRGRARMHIVHGLWRVSSLGSLGGQAGGDCKYSVFVCVCVRGRAHKRARARVCVCAHVQGHSCGIMFRPAGRHQDNTNTHTVLLLSLYFNLPMTPLFPSLSSRFSLKVRFPPTIRFSAPVSSSSLVDLCGAQPVVSGGTAIKKNKGMGLKWVFDQASWHIAAKGKIEDLSPLKDHKYLDVERLFLFFPTPLEKQDIKSVTITWKSFKSH